MKSKGWLYLAILSFIVALIWSGVSIVANLRKSTIPSDIQTIMAPINPNLDQTLLQKIQDRLQASQSSPSGQSSP